MSVNLSDLNLRAWVVDSERKPLPHFNVRRVAPDTIESWIPSATGEKFSIYFNGQNKSLGQNALDIHALAELDGRLKLDGVILPAAQRAGRHVGGILDQPVMVGKARPLKFGRLRVTDEDDKSDTNNHITTIKVRLEWGRFHEKSVLGKFRNPTNRGTAHERAVKDGNSSSTILGRKINSPVALLCEFEPDTRFEPQIFVFRYASQEWLRNHTHFLPSSESLCTNKKTKKKHANAHKEGSVKKRLKSEDFAKPVHSTESSGLGQGDKLGIMSFKTEPMD